MNIRKIVNECKERGTVRVKLTCPLQQPVELDNTQNWIFNITEKYVAEIVNAEEECYVRAVIRAAKEAGVITLDLIDKEFVVSAIIHEQERRGIK